MLLSAIGKKADVIASVKERVDADPDDEMVALVATIALKVLEPIEEATNVRVAVNALDGAFYMSVEKLA